jgi:regulator of sigma E protease
MATLTYILAAVVLLGLCIFVHELGHLLGGRMVGIKAKVFSIGYGRGILKKKIGDTTYQLTLIPLGGYCQFYGEDPAEDRVGEAYEFLSSHPLKRIVAVVMGPLFNLLFGIVLFFAMNLIGYQAETNRIYIPDYFMSGEYVSPAYSAGLQTGDTVVEINGKKIASFQELQSAVIFSGGRPLIVKASRGGPARDFAVQPRKYAEKGYLTIGVMPFGERVLVVRSLEKEVAANAGVEQFDEIKAVDGKVVRTPSDFSAYIRTRAGRPVRLEIVRAGKEREIVLTPRFREVLSIKDFEDERFSGERHEILVERLDLIRAAIAQGKVRINGMAVRSFPAFEAELRRNSGRVIRMENPGGRYRGIMSYEKYGFIGVETAVAPDMIDLKYGLADGFSKALVDPVEFIVMNIKGMGMLFAGELDVRQNLSGPIRIAKMAGDTAYYRGISAFIILMAKISIILMVMNLLPIPVVDGSFILFFLYEAVLGKPINQKILEKIQFVGIALLIVLGVLVVFNDLSFIPFFQRLFN